ncbi:MAG: potassium channel protein [Acidimicrobiia bacterium]|nr:potassium channel protein [Acidimicrobiia bacterium]
MEARNLREMLAEAKDTSELMVDLAYAALFFNDTDMADEVEELEQKITDLVHAMRTLCIIAVRNPREGEAMSAVLQVISAVEGIGNDAVDIAHIITRQLGIPRQLVLDLMEAEEIAHRVEVHAGSHFANRTLSSFELPVVTGMRVMAIRRGRQWVVDPGGDDILNPGDVLFLRGSPDGITRLRELAGAPSWSPPHVEEVTALTDLDRAVDTIVEMKNLSEVAVGLAYSALVFRDRSLAAEVRYLEDRLDEMKIRLELWVLRAARDDVDPKPLRGLLHLAAAAEDLGDQAQQMVWLVERQSDLHPVLHVALGDTDDVVVRMPMAADALAAGKSLDELDLPIEPGFNVLAIERDGRYLYRPRRHVVLRVDDTVLASGPEEGTEALAELFGWRLVESEEGEDQLEPIKP